MEEKVMTDGLEENENAVDSQEQLKSEKQLEKKRNKRKKAIITTTYFITVLCLLAGLLAPLFHWHKGADLKSCMMLQYIPSMINNFIGRTLTPIKEGGWFKVFEPATSGFDFMSLVGFLYAIVCVLALIACIFVFLGSKKKNTSANFALAIEVLTLLVTITYIAYTTYNIITNIEKGEGNIVWEDYNLLIPAGGALLMAIIQTITSKGSVGVSKVIAVIFSAIGLFTLLDITLFLPFLKKPLSDLSVMIKSGSDVLFIDGLAPITMGIHGISILFKGVASYLKSGDVVMTITYIAVIALVLLTVLNFIFDIIGLWTGKTTKKVKILVDGKKEKKVVPCRNAFSNTFAIVRYVLALLLAIAIVCIAFFAKKGITAGIYLYILALFILLSLINAAARTAVANSRYKKALKAASVTKQEPIEFDQSPFGEPAYAQDTAAAYEQPAYEQPEYQQPVYEQPAYEQPAYEQPVAQEPVVQEVYQPDYVSPDYLPEMAAEPAAEPYAPLYDEPEQPAEPTTVYYYGGDTDDFMDTLTDSEKVEFVELFVKKSKGSVNGVPDYVIRADNSDFFPAVFVHINRYRNIVSDELMSKMYKQLGKSM